MTNHSDADKKLIQRHFNNKASAYESAALLQREVGLRMLERLDYVTLQPDAILDLGCGTGRSTHNLFKRYKKARALAIDVSPAMLRETHKKFSWWHKPNLLCADAEKLPLADNSVDLVFSNLMLQWCEPDLVFAECLRVLKPQGLLLFSTFGPDTLKELRYSWQQADNQSHINTFIDMHVLGDNLLHTGFANPVMDMDIMKLTYNQPRDVMLDLKNMGANTVKHRARHGLTTHRTLQTVYNAYETFRQSELIPASFEVIYGHAWKTNPPLKSRASHEIHIPVNQLMRRYPSSTKPE